MQSLEDHTRSEEINDRISHRSLCLKVVRGKKHDELNTWCSQDQIERKQNDVERLLNAFAFELVKDAT